MEERKDVEAIKTTYDAATSETKGVKESLTEAQKAAAYKASLVKSTVKDPHTGQEYTKLTDPSGIVKNVSSLISTHRGTKSVNLSEAQQKILQRNIETGIKNVQIKDAYKKASEKGKEAMKKEGIRVSSYETVVPGFTPSGWR